MRKYSLALCFTLVAACVFSQTATPLATKDEFFVSWLCDTDYNDISALRADGSVSFVTMALNGANDVADRRYTAYNLDIKLPFGIEAAVVGGG